VAKYEIIIDGERISPEIQKNGATFEAKAGEKTYQVHPVGTNLYAVTVDGVRRIVGVAKSKDVFFIDIDSMLFEGREGGDDSVSAAGADQIGAKDKIFAPMPGKIVKIMVEVGDDVEIKQPMVIVEAMKMENQVNAKARGRVKAVNFSAGDQVDTEKPIIELELAE
jgi:biotin carboxyl carrier protein